MIAQVLGPLRVSVNGASVAPTALKTRKLLALLILNRDRVVQQSTIQRELWGTDSPVSAATGVQNCVMQIRKSLEQALTGMHAPAARESDVTDPKRILITEPTGYRLDVPDEHFDLRRHRELVAAADAADREGDLAQASAWLNSALTLWRDAPLADIPAGPVLQAHVRRLDEDHKSVLYRRLLLDLRLRRYPEVVGELRALTALHPFDEALHEYLMLALHLSGRPGDALGVYREFREIFVDGLGLEPSQRLQLVQQAILGAEEVPWPDRPGAPLPAEAGGMRSEGWAAGRTR